MNTTPEQLRLAADIIENDWEWEYMGANSKGPCFVSGVSEDTILHCVRYGIKIRRRPLPEPLKPVPLEPADWMKNGPWWVRATSCDKSPMMVVEVDESAIYYGRDCSSLHENAMAFERSNDGINWAPCYKLP